MTDREYQELVKKRQPRSPLGKDMARAWLTGGGICVLGQALSALYGALGLEETVRATLVTVTLIFLGALLTGLGVYDDVARFAGAGTLVPVTGFSNAVVAPALEFRREGLIGGTCARMFAIAGPVIVYGTGSSVVYGLLLAVFAGG